MHQQKFGIRYLKEGDYEAMLPWFKWFRFPAPPKDFLPENGLGGMMVYAGRVNVCSGFLYFTNSKVAWIEFVISNPEYRDKARVEAIKILLEELVVLCYEKGFKYVYTSVKNENLKRHLLDLGFMEGSTNATEMFIAI